MNPHEGTFVRKVASQPEPRPKQGRARLRFAVIVVVAIGTSLASYAQEKSLEVKCTVVDEMGAIIPNAEVKFKGQSGTIVSHTGLDGVVIQALRAGRYAVSVTQIGFVTTVLPDFNVAGTTQSACRIPLRVGDRPTDGPERQPAEHIEFPQIKEWGSLRIGLRRTTCLGACPSYTLTVLGNGSVIYHGDGFVHYCGDYRGNVSQQVVHQLVEVFRKADYFRLFSRYVSNATDLPAYTTSIAFDDKAMSVTDYWGSRVGMPDVVTEVENTIDRLAGPGVWAEGMDSHVDCEHSFIPATTHDVPNKTEVRGPK
ncbi:MAG: DUF6438 domain-containing protein [Candidatus Sulfotelmatobacter sp.]